VRGGGVLGAVEAEVAFVMEKVVETGAGVARRGDISNEERLGCFSLSCLHFFPHSPLLFQT
jgi:hypothetical protein